MKKLLLKLLLLLVLVGLTVTPVLYRLADGFSDRFYNKFLHRSASLITGSSRALLGLNPEAFDKTYPEYGPWLNFAFTQATSPYGEVYFDAIMRKVKKGEHPGLFVIEVGPLAVSTRGDSMPETRLILSRLTVFNAEPNFDYILKNNQEPLYFSLLPRRAQKSPIFIPHPNGWNQNLKEPDSASYAKGLKKSMEAYRKVFAGSQLSAYRLDWLEKTVEALGKYGKIVLLRMPVSPEMKAMENGYAPGFNSLMSELASRHKGLYLDLGSTTGWRFYDAHHMTSSSASRFSTLVTDTLHKLGVN